ncbi:MAG: PAS domain S-box protein [Candidatus Eisenbacteria bacterium]|nr:PAS domain S-box protein [Candidatus Eisenbacteria bacterium]
MNDHSRPPEELHGELQALRQRVADLERTAAEYKEAYQKQTENQENLRIFTETTPASVCIYQGTRIVYANPAAEETTGYTKEELIGREFWTMFHPEDQDLMKERGMARQRGEDTPTRYELRLISKDKRTVWFDFLVRPIIFEQNPAIMVTAFDISDRKRIEEELRVSEEKFRLLAETIDAVIAITHDEVLVYTNTATVKISGYTREELIENSILKGIHPDFRAMVSERAIARQRGDTVPSHYELKLLTKAGETRWVDAHFSRIEYAGRTCVLMTGYDITERKIAEERHLNLSRTLDKRVRERTLELQEVNEALRREIQERERAETALKENEAILRILLNAMPDLAILVNRQGIVTAINEAAAAANKSTGERLLGKCIYDNFPAELAKDRQAHTDLVFQTGRSIHYDEMHRDSIYSVDIYPVYSNKNEVDQVAVFSANITEKKKAEYDLIESEEMWRSLVVNNPEHVFILDAGGKIRYGNRVLPGRRIEDFLGKIVYESFPPEEQINYKKALNRLSSTGKTQTFEILYVDSDGSRIWFDNTIARILFRGDKNAVLVMARNITERKKSMEELQKIQEEITHAQRVLSMGEMATGLIHELNQPLCAIVNYTGGCLERLEAGTIQQGDLAHVMEEIAQLATHASNIIRNHWNFVRKNETKRPNVNLNQCIGRVIRLLEASIDAELITLHKELDESLPAITAVSAQIEQVLMNLLRNAIDAITELGTGVVIVRTFMNQNDMLEVVIIDTGQGISREIQKHMFDPFFTTKADGLGMGLSVSASIIESHNGRLWLESGSKQGTEFHFTLPVTQPDA